VIDLSEQTVNPRLYTHVHLTMGAANLALQRSNPPKPKGFLFSSNARPTLIDTAGDQARMRLLEF